MPFFTPPIVNDMPPFLPETRGQTLAYARHRPAQPRGRSVLKTAGVYTVLDGPTPDQQAAADITYLGGHWYYVYGQEEADLLAAGFTLTPDTVFRLYPLEDLYPDPALFPGFDHPVFP
jgi:hypothetical protein